MGKSRVESNKKKIDDTTSQMVTNIIEVVDASGKKEESEVTLLKRANQLQNNHQLELILSPPESTDYGSLDFEAQAGSDTDYKVQMQKHEPPFMKKHMGVILGCTLAFGAAGALIGAGIGIGMSVTATIPTFGLSILAGYAAIPIMSATLAVASAVVGLLVGLAIAAYQEFLGNQNRYSFYSSVPVHSSNDENVAPLDENSSLT